MDRQESPSTISRAFKGIWIPREVWLDKRLTYFEKCLLSEIHSLDNEHGCSASNKYLMDFFEEKERTIQCGLTKLKTFGYIRYESFDGRVRILRSNLYPDRETDKTIFNTSAPQDSAKDGLTKQYLTPLPCKILHPSPIGDFIEPDNKEYNKDKKKREGAAPPPPPPFIQNRVKMAQEKMNSLVKEFGEDKIKEMVSRLDEYADLNPKKFNQYGCHAAVIRKWIRGDKEKITPSKNQELMKKVEQRKDLISSGKIVVGRDYVEFPQLYDAHYKIGDPSFYEKVLNGLRKIGVPIINGGL